MLRWRILAVLLCMAASGCAHLATRQEKEDSFKPFADRRVQTYPLRDFLEARTALLVAGAKPLGVTSHTDQLEVGLKPTDADGRVDLGSAAAISSDGYFLTAAHCIRRQPVFLVVPAPGGPRALPARIVWQPAAPADNDCDLAVLHVPAGLRDAFEMADNSQVAAGQAVVTSGANGPAGGKLLQSTFQNADAARGLPFTYTLIHDVPLTGGDSGGPLTTLDGKLIGVEVLVRGVYLGPAQGVALRPDVPWLMGVIEKDRRRL